MDYISEKKEAQTVYDLLPQITERYSPRVFEKQAIDPQTLFKCFDAARWAASSYNQQPWRFIYGHQGTEAYDKIYNCLVEFNQSWAINAPVLVLTIIKEHFDSGKHNYHALHDLGLAMGNFTAQAQDMGLALHHMAGFDQEKAKSTFDLPEGYHPATCIAIGYYGGNPQDLPNKLQDNETAKRERLSIGDIAEEGKFPG